eukprot:TRINITY_DN94572_c0_g1_i1.p1 TRINITY_DN94572_c0_g1~~TRINITY_DN94572_c0_g1_i1.p1  ORF type:complete len:339 (+),score=35.13 TRINITY_DN94572_c0_g1_i1:712-1728(+)
MANKPLSNFTSTEFLDDKRFLRYVKHNSAQDVEFWEEWKAGDPENLAAFYEAELQLRIILSDKPVDPSADFMNDLLRDINISIDKHQLIKRKSKIRMFWISGIAASLVLCSGLLWFYTSRITVRADFAENKILYLPDGSEVRLNSNSEISYRRAMNYLPNRLVEVTGEAYFKVKHLNEDAREIQRGDFFLATTSHAIVKVLGTEFNLKDRHNKTYVSLIRGKIELSSIRTGSRYLMKPGESIDLDSLGNPVGKSLELSGMPAWLSGKLIVNQTTVREIIHEFEDLYGYQVILDSPELGEKKIDGTISIKSEESLLFTLKNILNVDVKKDGKKIYLKNR